MVEDHGITQGFKPTQAIAMIMASFASIALYNVIELAYIIFATFKRRKGLYFWSFIVATGSILPYTLGFVFKFFEVIPVDMISITMIAVGWCGMVTGQSVVLYSRLHLVVQDQRILRGVLIMIIVDAIICHVPILVLLYGSNSHNPDPYTQAYTIYEKVQITIFFLQEVVISGLYIWSTWTALKPGSMVMARELRKAIKHLLAINILIVVLDLTLLATEYMGHYEIQTLYKGALYSAKLKLEFRILNQLVSLTKAKSPRQWSNHDTTITNRWSAGHNMHTYTSSKGQEQSVIGYEAKVDRGEGADLGDGKSGIMLETTLEVSSLDRNSDSGDDWQRRPGVHSMEITREVRKVSSVPESLCDSQVEFAKR